MSEKTMLLKDFLAKFKGIPSDTEIIFGSGDLSFNRTKWRGDNLLQIEFIEMYEITLDPDASD